MLTPLPEKQIFFNANYTALAEIWEKLCEIEFALRDYKNYGLEKLKALCLPAFKDFNNFDKALRLNLIKMAGIELSSYQMETLNNVIMEGSSGLEFLWNMQIERLFSRCYKKKEEAFSTINKYRIYLVEDLVVESLTVVNTAVEQAKKIGKVYRTAWAELTNCINIDVKLREISDKVKDAFLDFVKSSEKLEVKIRNSEVNPEELKVDFSSFSDKPQKQESDKAQKQTADKAQAKAE